MKTLNAKRSRVKAMMKNIDNGNDSCCLGSSCLRCPINYDNREKLGTEGYYFCDSFSRDFPSKEQKLFALEMLYQAPIKWLKEKS